MNKREKNLVVVAAIMIVLLLAVGGTYAYWTTTQVQEDENKINTTCLDVKLENKTGENGTTTKGIELNEAYPISDTEGLQLDGYTFTVKNNCDEAVYYDVNLESLNIANHDRTTESDSYYLKSEYIKVVLDPKIEASETYKTLNEYTDVSQSFLDGTNYTSYEKKNLLNKKQLDPGKTDTHNLKMWVTHNAPDDQMLKHYQGKIVIYSWLGDSNPYPVN